MNQKIIHLRSFFLKEKERIFSDSKNFSDAFQRCRKYSELVESVIFDFFDNENLDFAIAATGGFCRYELAPFSDIDLMFIVDDPELISEDLTKRISMLWDCGLEVSHTIRCKDDIQKFFDEDLHAFTQFFENRFLVGNKDIYCEWEESIFSFFDNEEKKSTLFSFLDDVKKRHIKYGKSPKVLEPNIKYTAGGLRDIQVLEWIYSILNSNILQSNSSFTATQTFLNHLDQKKLVNSLELARVEKAYEQLLDIRNKMHSISNMQNDRFDFSIQEKVTQASGYDVSEWPLFMKRYFEDTSIIFRFSKTLQKRFKEIVSNPFPTQLAIELDGDFVFTGNIISIAENKQLSISGIIRAFYYRGIYDARFDENLRALIIESIEYQKSDLKHEPKSSVFMREILRMDRNVFTTLAVMNELGVLPVFMPEFSELVGFFQPGVYHCYTADEHTLISIKNLEKLKEEDSRLAFIYNNLLEKDLLYLAMLFHDIAKPISLSGHEILGAEIASTVLNRMGYEQKEIELIQFLVHNHLVMEQTAFRRDLNDPSTLDNFTSLFPSLKHLDMLYLVTYADLSAVAPVVWTQWKNDQLFELYRKTKQMLEDQLSGEELLFKKTIRVLQRNGQNNEVKEHIESINDVSYVQQFTEDEIQEHVREIERGSKVSVFFKVDSGFTNITILSKDSFSLLSKLCGVLSINDLNIHDARIFTRKDGIIIDSFNVTDYRSGKIVDPAQYKKIKFDLENCINGDFEISKEFKNLQSRWRRFENKIFRKKTKIKIRFEEHERFTIIDVSAPDKVGLLYTITKKLNELGLNIYFAKISTKADDVVDSFYTLDSSGKKVLHHDYELIRFLLTETISDLF